MISYCWIFSEVWNHLTFPRAFSFVGGFFASLNQTVLFLRVENLLFGILFLVISFSLNSSSEILKSDNDHSHADHPELIWTLHVQKNIRTAYAEDEPAAG